MKSKNDIFPSNYRKTFLLYKKIGLYNKKLISFIKSHGFGFFDSVVFYLENEPFGISYFLADSKNEFYDLKKMNERLNQLTNEYIAFGILIDDNPVCLNKIDKKIYLLDTNEEKLTTRVISNSMDDFINKLKEEDL